MKKLFSLLLAAAMLLTLAACGAADAGNDAADEPKNAAAADAADPPPTGETPENTDGCRANQEQHDDLARPAISGSVEDMDGHDVVFIGYPIWWGDMPRIICSFLESYDLSGKTIVPFCTHGGSGLSRTESTIADITGGTMKDGLAIPGVTAQNDRDAARSKVAEWLKDGGFVA